MTRIQWRYRGLSQGGKLGWLRGPNRRPWDNWL